MDSGYSMRGELRQPVIQRQHTRKVWQQPGNGLVIPKHAADSGSLMPSQWVSALGGI
jgi:hypothetical protein